MLRRVTLEQLVSDKGVVKQAEKIVEDNLERPLEREESIERTAERLTCTLVMLTSAKHSADKEYQQLRQVQDHVRLLEQMEERDARTIIDHLKGLLCAEVYDADTNRAMWMLLSDLRVQARLIDRINSILARHDEERYDELKKLMGELLVSLRDARYHVEQERKNLRKDEEIIDEYAKKMTSGG